MTNSYAMPFSFTGLIHRPGKVVRLGLMRMPRGVYPAGVPRQELVGAEIVHPAIGVRIAKAKGPDRTAIPDRMIRLHKMWQVSLWGHRCS